MDQNIVVPRLHQFFILYLRYKYSIAVTGVVAVAVVVIVIVFNHLNTSRTIVKTQQASFSFFSFLCKNVCVKSEENINVVVVAIAIVIHEVASVVVLQQKIYLLASQIYHYCSIKNHTQTFPTLYPMIEKKIFYATNFLNILFK